MKIMNKKKLKRLRVAKQTTAYKLLETEIAIMKKMNHPNIVRLYEIIDDPGYDKLFIIMEYISGGSLSSLMKDVEPMSIDKCWKYFRDLIYGLEYCHEVAGIIHRDIKPENLLIDNNDTLKIVDFGVSFMMNDGSDESKVNLGSALYLAPEICKGSVYKGRKTDIWATGVTLFRMATNKFPFEGKSIPGVYKTIKEDELVFALLCNI
jgi:[calcium/calmodulin-dependent protein kinase] kinase